MPMRLPVFHGLELAQPPQVVEFPGAASNPEVGTHGFEDTFSFLLSLLGR